MKKTIAAVGMLLLVFIVSACGFVESRVKEAQGDPVVQGDGKLTLYHKEGTVSLAGVGQAYFRQGAFSEPVNLILKEASIRRVSEWLPKGFTLVGPLVHIETKEGLEPLEMYQLTLQVESKDLEVFYLEPNPKAMEIHWIRDGEATVMVDAMGYYGVFKATPEPTTTEAPETTTTELETTATTTTTTVTTTVETTTEEVTTTTVPTDGEAPTTTVQIMPQVVMLKNGDSNLYQYNFETEKAEVFKALSVEVFARSINPRMPMAVYNSNGEVGLVNLLTNETFAMLGPNELELYQGVWSPDGEYLAMTVRHSLEDKTIVYIYGLKDHRLSALVQGNGNAMCWSDDSRTLVFSQQNYKRATESYQLVVNKATVYGDVDTIYTITVKEGAVMLANDTATNTQGKVYAVAGIKDEALGAFTLGLVYNFNSGAYESFMTFPDLYADYISNFPLDQTLKAMYSQLGHWTLPEVILLADGKQVFLSDGNGYYYYPNGKSSGEVEITGYHSLEAVYWPDIELPSGTND